MQLNTRMQALLDQTDMNEEDSLPAELIDLETQLTIHELLLLLQVVVMDGQWPYEPLIFHLFMADRVTPRTLSAAVLLPESVLRQLAGQARLERLELLTYRLKEDREGWEYVLTPKGARAVEWWGSQLVEEVGFQWPAALTTD